jgi:hypothetical protein
MPQVLVGAVIGWAVAQALNASVVALRTRRAAKAREREKTGYSGRTFEHKA